MAEYLQAQALFSSLQDIPVHWIFSGLLFCVVMFHHDLVYVQTISGAQQAEALQCVIIPVICALVRPAGGQLALSGIP